jgi:hypothetical protein
MSRPWSFSSLFRRARLAELKSRRPRAARPVLEALEDRLAPTVSWTGGAGTLDWNDAANWSRGAVPGPADDVLINVAVTGPITVSAANTVHSLTDTTAPLAFVGGSLSLAAASSVNQDVTLSSGALFASGSLSIGGALTQSGGLLTGAGTVTVSGLLTWTGGIMSGSGTTLANGGLQLGLNDGNSYSEALNARTLINAGSAVWVGTDRLDQSAGSIFRNLPLATLDVQGTATLNDADSAGDVLDNQGTLTIDTGSARGTFGGVFTNERSVLVHSGTLALTDGGTATGSLQIDSGAEVLFPWFTPHYAFTSGASVTGAGTFEVDADASASFSPGTTYNLTGTTNIFSGTAVFDASAATGILNETGGNLGGSATLTVSGLTTWTGGTMSGPGATDAQGGLNLGQSSQSDNETLAGRTLVNLGTGAWYDSDTLTQVESSLFLNSAGATLTIVGGTQSFDFLAADSSGTFANQGTMVVADGTGATLIWNWFSNSGSVEVKSGTLHLGAGGIVTGSVVVDAGATLLLGANFNYDAFQFSPSASLSGAGTVDFDSGVAAYFASGANYDVTGTTVINSGGNANANVVFEQGSTVQAVGALTIQTGVINFGTGSTITPVSLTQSGGTLTGPDTVTVSGLTTWIDGTMSGAGTTVAAGGLLLGVADGGRHYEVLNARTFINSATANWVGSGEIDLFNGGTFINQAGATFDQQNDDTIWTDIGVALYPGGLFVNQGSFLVDAGSGTAGMQAPFNNSGTVEIRSGIWELSGNGSATGTFTVDAGTTFKLNKFYNGGTPPTILGPGTVTLIDGSNTAPGLITGGPVTIPTKTQSFFRVDGNVTVSSLAMTDGYLVVAGTLTVTGPMTWTGGYIVGPGTVRALGGLQIGANDGNTGHYEALCGVTLINAGTGVMYDSFAQQFGSTFVNQAGASLTIGSDGTWSSDGSIALVNAGSITKTAGTGTSVLSFVSLLNSGSVAVSSGTLDLEGAGIETGSFSVASGTTIDFAHSYWGFNSGSNVSGAGTVEFPFNYWLSGFNPGSTYNVSGTTQIGQAAVDFFPGSSAADVGALTLDSGGSSLEFSTGSPVSATSFDQQFGVVTGVDTLSVSGPTTWTGGTMSGIGTTLAAGGLQLGTPGHTNDSESLVGRTLDDAGGGTLVSHDLLNQYYGSTCLIPAGATLSIQVGVRWQSESDGTATIESQGAILVAAGSGTATLSSYPVVAPFLYSSGSIEVSSGTLQAQTGGGTTTGSLTADAGATLQFTDDFHVASGASISGAGTVEFTSGLVAVASGATYAGAGTTLIDGGSLALGGTASIGMLDESAGILTGAGQVTISGPTTWTGGRMDGSGSTVATGGLALGLPADSGDHEVLDGRTFVNAAAAVWAGGGSFGQYDGSTFVNPSSATLTITNDLNWDGDGTGALDNAGILIKSAGTGTTTLYAALNSTGSVQVQIGVLSLQTGGTPGGTYTILAAGTLEVSSDAISPSSPTFPNMFTSGNWAATYSGTATDHSGTGLASVGVSLFDGTSYWDGTAFESPTPIFNPASLSGSTWSYTIAVPFLTTDAPYTVESRARDNASGIEPSVITSLVLDEQGVPVVSGVSPAAGPPGGGTQVTIHGADLAGATAVDFGLAPATIFSESSSAIVVMAPPGALGAVDVTVTTANGISSTSVADEFTYVLPPNVTGVAPSQGPVAGGTTVTITGTGLAGATEVDFGSTLASIVSDSDSEIVVTSPPGAPGVVLVTVTTAGGTSDTSFDDQFTYMTPQPPSFVTPATAVFRTGQPNSFTLLVAGFPAPSLTESGPLPRGVGFLNNGDGTATLSGTPDPAVGAYVVNLTATNGFGPAATQVFTLDVIDPPAITSGSTTTFTVGKAGSFTVTTSAGLPVTTTLSASGKLPSGVGFVNSGNGIATLKGTPAAGTGGTYTLLITAGNASGSQTTQTFTLTVDQAPAITSAAAATFVVGLPASFTVTTKGFPVAALTEAGALPSGISFADNGNGTGTLSGTPAAGSASLVPYSLTITAANGVSPGAVQTFKLSVDQPPAITSGNNTTFTVGKAGSFSVTTTPGLPKVTTLGASGKLPSGVSFVNNGNGNATLKGTPAAGSGGTYPVSITASDAAVSFTTQTFTLTVDQAPAITSAAAATFVVGQAASFTVTTKGFPVAALTESGALPGGVSFTDNGNGTATFSGTPAAGSASLVPYSVTLAAANGVAPTATQTFKLTVDQPPTITSGSSTTFTVGKGGSFTVTTSAGLPVTTALSAIGKLPSGVSFVNNGNGTATLKGTPAARTGGTHTVIITASNAAVSFTTQTFTLTVDQAPAITSVVVATFVVGQPASFTITTKGFPVAALSESGALPGGISFTDNGNGTGTVSGTPAAGSANLVPYTLTLTAANGVAPAATQAFKLTVDQPPTITSGSSTTFTVGKAGSFTVTTTPGLPKTTTLSASGKLPSGVSFVNNGNGTATLKGTPAAGTGGSYTLIITASNAAGSQTTQTFSLTVDQAPAITNASAVTLTAGQSASFTVTTKGFPVAALTESGALPAGVTFVDNGDGTATLKGIPHGGTGGSYTLSLIASSSVGSVTQKFTLTVNQPAIITSADKITFTAGQSNSFTITTAAFPLASISILGTLPVGLTLLNKGDGTALLSGKPSVKGTFTFTFVANDGLLPEAFQSFELTVV